MANFTQIKKAFSQIQVIRPPKYHLSTFGSSQITYLLVTDVPGFPDRSRLRTGTVAAERPALITSDTFKKRFDGFGPEGEKIADYLLAHYGRALAGLEYKFKNHPEGSKIELSSPEKLAKKLSARLDSDKPARTTLLRSADRFWEISIMKFIVEETLSSFPGNVQELSERGFFEGEDREEKRREREIKNLFSRAKKDPALVKALGKKLKDYGLFEEYQDQFFQLVA